MEAVAAHFKVASWNSPVQTEENQERVTIDGSPAEVRTGYVPSRSLTAKGNGHK